MMDSPQVRLLQQLGQTYRAMLATFESRLGISMPRWRILRVLYQQGVVPQKQLVADLRVDPAALTRQLKALDKLGLVQRARDEQDNRTINVMLTDAGHAWMAEHMPHRAAFINQALSGLPAAELGSLESRLAYLEECLRKAADSG